ncbi:sigma-70 family RNA polymerase sigma factor [Anaeromassilibacillus sp. An250]|uniref:sigma-70 family RNA polymerase sigma factor n=1 Tax=Anaeromassilibacillus sp. An250 TaxID=1965604 RepID=UPI000B38EB46|nr:sigma-70 family RNA polymerase sigma factor [Anaeromassilibacillus sp. An250]OUO72500.1 hypothetical protein B5F54_15005 [Anaeromassilibacillus sp. An250]
MWHRNDGASEANIIQNKFTAYLITAVANRKAAYMNKLKAHRRAMEFLERCGAEVETYAEFNLDEGLPLMEQIENPLLLQALLQIKDWERHILLARLLDERSFIELSKNLGVSYKAVSNSYYRLILKLRRMMKGDAMHD